MIPVGPNSKAEDISTSSKTGVKYFNRFFLDLPTRNASFTFTKWIREAEITPTVEQRYMVIPESYGEGKHISMGNMFPFMAMLSSCRR